MNPRNSSKGCDGFWEAYRACTEENGVRPDRSPFCVNWAKDFANFLPEKPLEERSRKDIEAFLADLGKRRGIAREAINNKVSCHTLPHFLRQAQDKRFAMHLLEVRYDIRTVQGLLGHANVVTTMIYTHVLNRPGLSVKSPADI
ncbi:MAG: tyrosine-type recombinase/integrase [Deltaproteobacteria bacterium]